MSLLQVIKFFCREIKDHSKQAISNLEKFIYIQLNPMRMVRSLEKI